MYHSLLSIDAEGIPGDIVECGVWRGGNIMMARMVLPTRTCWLYDTFDGMTEPDHDLDVKRTINGIRGERAIDRFRNYTADNRWNKADIYSVQKSFEDNDLIANTKWIVGPVEETLLSEVPTQIALLRLDMDWYLPTRISLERLYPKLSPGGFLIIDDYGHWLGCKKAVDDYLGRVPMTEVDYSCVVVRKP